MSHSHTPSVHPLSLPEDCIFSSLTMSDYIPKDILVHTLKCLPVIYLLRSRCVCKRWKQLIDSPTFVQEHLAVQKPRFIVECRDAIFLLLDPLTLPWIDMLGCPILGNTKRLSLIGTLHGVVCLYDCVTNLLLIWNPSLRKFVTLTVPLDFECACGDATKIRYGFWIDPANNEFKILSFRFDVGEGYDIVGVKGILYSASRRDWIAISPGRKWTPWQHGPPVLVGGVAHWGGWDELGNDQKHQHKTNIVMSFDFGQESFEFIEMPNLNYLDSFRSRLCHWQGTLALVHWDRAFPHRCNIYSRQEGSWVNIFGFGLLGPMEDVFWLLEGMEEKGRALVAQRFYPFGHYGRKSTWYYTRPKLALYDTNSGSSPLVGGIEYVNLSYDFVESLVFPWSSTDLVYTKRCSDLQKKPRLR